PDVAQRELGADQQRQAAGARLQMGAHDSGERAFVGDRERRIAERLRPVDEFFGMGGAAQEREVRDAVQLGIGGEHRSAVLQGFEGWLLRPAKSILDEYTVYGAGKNKRPRSLRSFRADLPRSAPQERLLP